MARRPSPRSSSIGSSPSRSRRRPVRRRPSKTVSGSMSVRLPTWHPGPCGRSMVPTARSWSAGHRQARCTHWLGSAPTRDACSSSTGPSSVTNSSVPNTTVVSGWPTEARPVNPSPRALRPTRFRLTRIGSGSGPSRIRPRGRLRSERHTSPTGRHAARVCRCAWSGGDGGSRVVPGRARTDRSPRPRCRRP